MSEIRHLESLRKNAIDAHRGTSFDPEKRGDQLISGYDELLCEDLEQLKECSEEIREDYKQKFIGHLSKWLSAKSRIVSTMISGGSNFPVARMQKYNKWEHTASKAFSEWREYKISRLLKNVERFRPAEEKIELHWAKVRDNIMNSIKTIRDIDSGKNRYSARPLFVSSIVGSIKTLAKNHQTEMVRRSLELIREENKKGTIITDRNSIWKIEVPEEPTKQETKEYSFDGGIVVVNYELGRIQIVNDSKPSQDVINKYKSLGFKWSPSNKAWQVFLHNTGAYKAEQMTGIKITL